MPLRDLTIVLFVGITLLFVFKHAYIGVYLWTWISIMNPHKLSWGFAFNAPLAAAAAGATLIGLFTTRDRVKLPMNAVVLVLIGFVLWMCATTFFAINPRESTTYLNRVLKIQVMTLVAMAVLFTREHIRLFLWINVLSVGFYGVKGGLFTLTTGGTSRVWGPPGGFMEGNNELALGLIITLPLMNYLRMTSPYRWVRIGLVVMMILSAFSALGTQSRGALLAMMSMAALLWWRAPGKSVTAVAILILGIALVAFMPQRWYDRMQTITEYQQDSSALGRLNAWQTMVRLANDRPTGGGFEIYTPEVYQRYAPDPDIPRAAHSIYFQVLGEHGYLGLLLFLTLWVLTWRVASRIRKAGQRGPEVRWLRDFGGMAQVALAGYAVGGAFLSLAYFDLPYNILLTLIVAQRWLNERGWEREPTLVMPTPPVAVQTAGERIRTWIRTA